MKVGIKRIGRIIKSKRIEIGWSATRLATRLGLHSTTIPKYENGTRTPRPALLKQMIAELGLNPDLEIRKPKKKKRKKRVVLTSYRKSGFPKTPKTPKKISNEQVNHPSHYGGKDNPYEAIKVIEAWNLPFTLGNTVKYISRAGKKGDNKIIQDLKKALWYLQHEIETLEKQKNK